MATSAAERQRRSRAHRKGDHSLCSESCDGVTVTAPVTSTVTAPAGQELVEFSRRGRRLWRQMHASGATFGPAETVLIEEACRLADRLDRLDALLRGDEDAWLRLRDRLDGGGQVVVILDSALGEARMHATALKQIVAELRQGGAKAGGNPGTGQGGSIVDQLAAQREKRFADSAGS